RGKYWLTRIIILRYLGFIFSVAFLVALNQNEYLIGDDGLLPAKSYLERLEPHLPVSILSRVSRLPTLFWVLPGKGTSSELQAVATAGLAISLFVALRGACPALLVFLLWALYHSLVNVGQAWYAFGWESQLLETAFLCAFLGPLTSLSLTRCPTVWGRPTPQAALWAHRWLIFRIMLGAGLIKIRGDRCWLDLTCMDYHYETQPVPNPLSPFLHTLPAGWHQFETLANHVVELLLPWLLLMPRHFRLIGGVCQVLFQMVLICSGNLSFLNWLTILPCLSCFDDESLKWMFSQKTLTRVILADRDCEKKGAGHQKEGTFVSRILWHSHTAVSGVLVVLISWLSIPVVSNLLSEHQAMNTSFDSLRLVNSYGAFGSITKQRHEVVLMGTMDLHPGPAAAWREYDFLCKPGDPARRPCLITPYHYRLDWLMWFAAFQDYQRNPWLINLAVKLLCGDKRVTRHLMAGDPFPDGRPRFIKADLYSYKYAQKRTHEPKAEHGKKHSLGDENAMYLWWHRDRVREYFPPLHLSN
ncbi:unnamed protein product, partial [Heterosigma akashiwo]